MVTPVGRFGYGSEKVGGPKVLTYSRLEGPVETGGTCPGATELCELVCYATGMQRYPTVESLWTNNTKAGCNLPTLPENLVRDLRIHVSGDFDTPEYVEAWIDKLKPRKNITGWAYTHSWHLGGAMLKALRKLQRLSNMQLFISIDDSLKKKPFKNFRHAYLLTPETTGIDWNTTIICPAARVPGQITCEQCRFCLEEPHNKFIHVAFPIHGIHRLSRPS